VLSYFDQKFADVHHRLDELFLEHSQGREDIAALREAVGREVDVVHEAVLGLERELRRLADRVESLERADEDRPSGQ